MAVVRSAAMIMAVTVTVAVAVAMGMPVPMPMAVSVSVSVAMAMVVPLTFLAGLGGGVLRTFAGQAQATAAEEQGQG